MKIHVPRPILDYFCECSSVQHLTKNTCKEIITHANIEFVITGFASNHHKGYLWCHAKPLVPLALYKEDLEPLSYNQHLNEVTRGTRERGYNGILINFENKQYVILPGKQVTFYPTEEGTQTKLFN